MIIDEFGLAQPENLQDCLSLAYHGANQLYNCADYMEDFSISEKPTAGQLRSLTSVIESTRIHAEWLERIVQRHTESLCTSTP
ncbi:MAG: hypothetical protein WCO60_20195 [Verrucomicrobiota bacterium]